MRISVLAIWITFVVAYHSQACSQTVDYDWAARSLQDYPTNITQTRSAAVRVHNVNDVLYSYTVKSECTQNQADPFGSIAGLLPASNVPPKPLSPSECQKALDAARAAVDSV